MIKRKYVVLSLLTLVFIMLGGLFYSNLAQAQSTITGYVSIPAAAFVPQNNAINVTNGGSEIYNCDLGSTMIFLYASVQLPHGATVTNFTFYWYDKGIETIICNLFRYTQFVRNGMASATSSGAPEYGSSYDDTIVFATVDNNQYAYYLYLGISYSISHMDYRFQYAIIEYELPSGAVGGFWIPINKFSLLVPYIALVSTIIMTVSMSVVYIKHRKKQ